MIDVRGEREVEVALTLTLRREAVLIERSAATCDKFENM